MKALCDHFGCSISAIWMDVQGGALTKRDKRLIKERDNYMCQYCLRKKSSTMLVVDHVIPSIHGGVSDQYNLVCCCNLCNHKKSNRVVVPKNINILAGINKEYAEKIISMSKIEKLTIKKNGVFTHYSQL